MDRQRNDPCDTEIPVGDQALTEREGTDGDRYRNGCPPTSLNPKIHGEAINTTASG
jgi:hypothetical protein